MRTLYHLAQYLGPIVGLVALVMLSMGLLADPMDWSLLRQSLLPFAFSLLFRPRPGHPMATLLGMHRAPVVATPVRSPAPPPVAEDAKMFLRDAVDQNMAVLDHEPGDLPHHAEPVKLVPSLPGEPAPGKSWIGGAPMLPAGQEWPHANGQPMLFVGQIALDELPAGIWGGIGPHHGWLAVFMPSDGRIDQDTRVLHFHGPVAERAWPEVSTTFHHGQQGDRARETLKAAGIALPPHPPRFPVRVERHEGPLLAGRPVPAGERLRQSIQRDYDPRTPEFRPFDRRTALALIASLIAGQRAILDATLSFTPLPEEERASREKAVEQLEDIAADLASENSMGADAIDAFMERLRSVSIERAIGVASGPGGETRISILDEPRAQKDGRVPFELLVREAMNTAPGNVPDVVRARYEALWRYDQAHEYPTMGGAVHDGFVYSKARDPVFLLEIPSSDLVGWMFGDFSSFGVFIAPDDLRNGQWQAAWGDMLN